SFNAGWNDGDGNVYATTVSASNGGVVDLSGVQSLVTPARGEDRIDFVMSAGGNINLDGLEQINGGGKARFVVPSGASYALPQLATANNLQVELAAGATLTAASLQTVNGNYQHDDLGLHLNYSNNRRLSLGDSATLNAPALTALTSTAIELSPGAVFNAPQLDRMNYGLLRLAPGSTL